MGKRGKTMIVIQKRYRFFLGFCIFSIALILFFKYIPYRHIYFNSKQIEEFHYLAKQSNATAMSKLINYYLAYESFDEALDTFRQYKNISKDFKRGYYHFLRTYKSEYQNEMIPLAIELANDGDYYVQINLADFYTYGRFVEKDLQKAAYWTKIAKCNKKGIDIKNCKLLKGKE